MRERERRRIKTASKKHKIRTTIVLVWFARSVDVCEWEKRWNWTGLGPFGWRRDESPTEPWPPNLLPSVAKVELARPKRTCDFKLKKNKALYGCR